MPRAPKHCGYQGCTTLVPKGRCDKHKHGWGNSPRTASSDITRTKRWQDFRKRILDRDNHTCQIQYPGICTQRATVVDKIIPASRRPDLAFVDSNAQAACRPCNDHKNQTEDRH